MADTITSVIFSKSFQMGHLKAYVLTFKATFTTEGLTLANGVKFAATGLPLTTSLPVGVACELPYFKEVYGTFCTTTRTGASTRQYMRPIIHCVSETDPTLTGVSFDINAAPGVYTVSLLLVGK